MDNGKMGALIKELRKEKALTQNDLARQLHITDRAVSKWERGLCAPDLSLLEPLAKILGISVVELLAGERAGQNETPEQVETAAKTLLRYSQHEMLQKIKTHSRRYRIVVFCMVLAMLIGSVFLWQQGYFFVLDRRSTPDGSACAVVYDKELKGKGFSLKDGISLIVATGDGGELRTTYGDCTYQGLWWSPDGRKYVLALDDCHGGSYLELTSLEDSSAKNLTAYLTMGVEATEIAKYGNRNETGWIDIAYQFLQWSKDSKSMLLYYSFLDRSESLHEGYFWYHCASGDVNAVLELGK